MVSPESQDSDVGLCSARSENTRRTTADREQRNPQAGGSQMPKRHVFRVEGDESVIEGVVGGHFHSTSFHGGGKEMISGI